jgi:hypothetical protein
VYRLLKTTRLGKTNKKLNVYKKCVDACMSATVEVLPACLR